MAFREEDSKAAAPVALKHYQSSCEVVIVEIRGTLGRKTFPRKVRGTADPSAAPDFLLSAMGSAKLMRLSLMKAANEVIFGAA
jgi:hypothetical protein